MNSPKPGHFSAVFANKERLSVWPIYKSILQENADTHTLSYSESS